MSIFAPTPQVIEYLKTHFSDKLNSSSLSSPQAQIEITIYSPQEHSHFLPFFADIHIDCILTDHTIATFTVPINDAKRQRMIQWWDDRSKEVVDGNRLIFMALATSNENKTELAGYVSLAKPVTETGPFRGPVEKLLVSPRWRRKGIARMLMEKLEVEARREGRWLLLLDTEQGSPAEEIYPKLGYTCLGVIPNYGISPKDGTLIGGTYFWKDIREAEQHGRNRNEGGSSSASNSVVGNTAVNGSTNRDAVSGTTIAATLAKEP